MEFVKSLKKIAPHRNSAAFLLTPVSPHDTSFLVDERLIGTRIRSLREQSGLSLTSAAAKSGVTKSTLSKIETGRVSSPISTLLRIAQSLEVPIAEFFNESDRVPAYVLTRKNKGRIISQDGSKFGYSYEALALEMQRKIAEPFLLTIKPEDPAGSFSHGGQEFIYMLAGSMEFTIGEETFSLHPGDSLYFDPANVHTTKVRGKTPAKFLCVFVQKPFT
jgi:transcriptional regulator with XRE-family HTH domain